LSCWTAVQIPDHLAAGEGSEPLGTCSGEGVLVS